MAQRRSLPDYGDDPYGNIFGPASGGAPQEIPDLGGGLTGEAPDTTGSYSGEYTQSDDVFANAPEHKKAPARGEESPRDRVTTGQTIRRIPPSSGVDELLRPDSQYGGSATPTMPRTPTPQGGVFSPGQRLFGRADGLLEGGYGVPESAGVGGDDPSALIEQLLALLGGGQEGF